MYLLHSRYIYEKELSFFWLLLVHRQNVGELFSMLAHFFSFLLRWLSVYRWSNYPRVEQPTTLDHIGFSMHVAFLLADLVENENIWKQGIESKSNQEPNPKRVSRNQIFLYSLYSVIFNCMYSDIHSDVKHAIKVKRPDLFAILQKKMVRSVLSWNLPKKIHEAFLEHEAQIDAPKDSLEKDIFTYAKLVSTYFEAKFQARVYPEIYSKSIEWIQSRMQNPRFDEFRKLLDVTKDTELVKYLLSVRRLESAYRWNRLKRSYPVSVMSHLYLVGVISFFLFHMESRSEEEIEEALLRSLLHDVPEAITGDIITPTKKAALGLSELIWDIEKEFVHELLLAHLETYPFHDEYAKRLLDPWEGSIGKNVKQADLLCAFLEAKIEELQNPFGEQFKNAWLSVARKIRDIGSPSAKDLLNHLEEGVRIYLPDIN